MMTVFRPLPAAQAAEQYDRLADRLHQIARDLMAIDDDTDDDTEPVEDAIAAIGEIVAELGELASAAYAASVPIRSVAAPATMPPRRPVPTPDPPVRLVVSTSPAPPAPRARRAPRRPTFREARATVWAALRAAGWSVDAWRKTPRALYPHVQGRGAVALYFRPQSVWIATSEIGEPRLRHARSTGEDIRDWARRDDLASYVTAIAVDVHARRHDRAPVGGCR